MTATNFGKADATSYAVLLGTGTDTNPETVGTVANKNFLDFRLESDGASGDARGIYTKLYLKGAGGGEAGRFYAVAGATAVATGGTINGVHASLDVDVSSSVSGAGNAIRATLEAESQSRTLGGTCSALQLDSSIGASNTVPDSWSLIRVTKTGSVSVPNFISFADTQCLKGDATLGSLNNGIKIRLSDGSLAYIPIYK
jgi:hypothetical protein